jgi:hypothetical protein
MQRIMNWQIPFPSSEAALRDGFSPSLVPCRPTHGRPLTLAILALALLTIGAKAVPAQQVIDPGYSPRIPDPMHRGDARPVVLVDRGHNSFHAGDDAFAQLATLLAQDGYLVRALTDPYTFRALAEANVLVVVNPLADADLERWELPTTPAFSPDEISAVRGWVDSGGSVLLVADHMPFPGAVSDLGRAFGVEMMNGFAIVETEWDPLVFRRDDATLRSHPITDGRQPAGRVDWAVTFVSGHAFRAIDERVCPLLVLRPGVVSINMDRAWHFDDATPRVDVEGWLQGAALEVGAGRVAIFGEAAMFAAQLVGPGRRKVGMNDPSAGQNLQLLRNTLGWLSRAPGFSAPSCDAQGLPRPR